MSILKSVFYSVALLTLVEVLEIRSLYLRDTLVSFSSEWTEPPQEEDESKEYEDDEDFFFLIAELQTGYVITQKQGAVILRTDPLDPITAIVVPPPQG